MTAQPPVYTLKDCLEQGLLNNYSLRITRNQERVSENNASLANAGALPTLDLSAGYSGTVSDTETTDRITIDMSGMMDGVILYAKSDYNETLSRWLDVDTSTMPPIYTMSGKIYVLRLQDGTHAAIHLLGYANEQNTKGYMTFEYLYPLENAFN